MPYHQPNKHLGAPFTVLFLAIAIAFGALYSCSHRG